MAWIALSAVPRRLPDLLLLRAEAGEVDPEVAEWWPGPKTSDAGERARMTSGVKRQASAAAEPKFRGGVADDRLGGQPGDRPGG